ncbi:hypothetical protein LTR94_034412, partial [Friedmanniomyces endolithicus]
NARRSKPPRHRIASPSTARSIGSMIRSTIWGVRSTCRFRARPGSMSAVFCRAMWRCPGMIPCWSPGHAAVWRAARGGWARPSGIIARCWRSSPTFFPAGSNSAACCSRTAKTARRAACSARSATNWRDRMIAPPG